MKEIKLDKRLQAVAGFVRKGSKVVDIGTDHGYLPIYLALHENHTQVIAADVHKGPLESARKNLGAYQVEDRVQTVLSDGLKEIPPQDADDIIIAGMGGELIIQIIDAACWVKDTSKRLILQPMTGFDLLRRYLYENGFAITGETPIYTGSHAYCALCVEYAGVSEEISDCFAFLGTIPRSDSDEKYPYMHKQLNRVRKMLQGAVATENAEDEQRYGKLENEISKLME